MNQVIASITRGPGVLAAARNADLNVLTAAELVELSRVAQDIVREAEALSLAALAAAKRKDAHTAAGATSVGALFAEQAGVSKREAHQRVRLAERLDTSAPATREALSQPGMSHEKARIVTDAVDALPDDLTEDEKAGVERSLAETAPQMSVEQLRRMASRAIEVLDIQRANVLENSELKRRQEIQRRRTRFWMTRPDTDGMVKGGFEIDELTADMLRSVIESKTSPRYGGTGQATERDDTQDAVLDAPPAHDEKAGDAFTEIVRHLPSDAYGNHGGVAATLLVTVSEDSLRGRTDAAGTTEHGTRISAGELRRLACDAGLLPAILDGTSQVLDLGRERRLHTPAQRVALAHRDGGCAFPGCDRPPGWCESHHVNPWNQHGPTTVDNGVLLCAAHHRLIHQTQWEVHMARDGLPVFLPPAAVDPHRRPRRNHRYRPLVA